MLTIQELGMEILTDKPKKFYVFGGTEYGVKDKYLEHLTEFYSRRRKEVSSVSEITSLFSKKHFIPLEPTLYIVRYDESFVANLNDAFAEKVKKLKIVGTVVCIYENTKHVAKCDKYLPEYTGTIDSLDSNFMKKYLTSDFPNLSQNMIDVAIEISENYGHAKNICRSMSASNQSIHNLDRESLKKLFGYVDTSTETQIRQGVAARNFSALAKLADKYPESADMMVYTILQTMIELEKCKTSRYVDSDIKNFAKNWTFEDIYYMFVNTYEELKKLRSMSISDPYNSLIYLFGLLKYSSIPSKEVME